ncbi:hypothetical protein G7B40_015105 [Aetokthonos hydrillicola Thurmond2011]|uniref:Uncharacterized protein n=1 Tax=Aetokthonos hydrillicola Thurmond2011 TaxID=2712845 RepID=A0AAP5I6G9_9CYAN|nr:hypothetical protein [Aetokthonos hydrillicola]MBO3461897.1 hypothetical protein [Aetokthonos hydrillicola CCALA 1050]MBW4586761.1 hypothetical protein [Aetokthonos hydrillicola CCALA 1050]MDR9895882.1 hypothetical protein [Aetokthonos hydrillicola Thurmond2011]
MGLNFKTLCGLLVLFASINFSGAARAQTATSGYESPNDVFERAFFKNDPNFYGNQTFKRHIDLMFGPGSLFKNSFPENEIARDAELVNTVYRDALTQQANNDPYIRTPDLPNPYNTSLLMSPRLNPTKLQTGTEFRFETLPPR